MVRWLKQNGLATSPLIFTNGKITPEFSLLYGLNSAETEQLNQLYQQATEGFDQLTRKHARRDPASTPAKLIVVVPPFPTDGGEIYNRFVADFSSVLGRERAESFNAISGDLLEGTFGSFGLEHIRYEITRRPADHGWQFYDVIRSNALSATTTEHHPFVGHTLGSLRAEDLRKNPALTLFDLPTIDTVTPPALPPALPPAGF